MIRYTLRVLRDRLRVLTGLANSESANVIAVATYVRAVSTGARGVDDTAAAIIRGVERPSIAALPPMRELMRADDATSLHQLRRAFNGQYGKPGRELELEITGVNKGPDGISIAGVVRDEDGVNVGLVGRRWFESDGRLIVDHENTSLYPTAHGRGFAADLGGALTGYYRRSGVHSVELTAVHDGRFVWPRLGADWSRKPMDVGYNSQNIRAGLDEVGRDTATTPADRSTVEAWAQRFDPAQADDWPSPRELLELRGDNPQLGHRIMEQIRGYFAVQFL